MKILSLSKIEKLKLIGQCIRAATGIIGASLVLAEGYPYTTLAILATGAVSNEVVSFIKQKETDEALASGQSLEAPDVDVDPNDLRHD